MTRATMPSALPAEVLTEQPAAHEGQVRNGDSGLTGSAHAQAGPFHDWLDIGTGEKVWPITSWQSWERRTDIEEMEL